MIAYGKIKRSFKIHPHNECCICGECKINKMKERKNNKVDLTFEYDNKAILNNNKRGKNVVTK
jgi:hypothetical protein